MNEKILIVDDDLETLRLIGLMLQRRGYQIIAAQSGAQALDKALTEQPDIILLDVMMPGMDGIEVCHRLRIKASTARIPIIMFTAKTAADAKLAGLQAGADEYLTKPIHPAELASRVAAILQRIAHTPADQLTEPTAQSRVIGLLGCKGGVGNTTLAINIAVALSQHKKKDEQAQRVVLAEPMTGGGNIGLYVGITRDNGVGALLSISPEDLQAEDIDSQIIPHTSGVKLLLAPHTPRTGSFPPAHIKPIIRRLADQNDYVILDLGTGLDDSIRAALHMCHSITIVIESQRVALTSAQTLLQEMESAGIPRSKAGLALVNRVPSAASFTRSTIEKMLHMPLLTVIPPAPELTFQATESGIPLVLMQPNSLISAQIQDLARKISTPD